MLKKLLYILFFLININLFGNDIDSNLQLGFKYLDVQDYEKAIAFFSNQLEQNVSNKSNIYYGLGVAYSKLKKIEEAESYLYKSINDNNKNYLPYYELGNICSIKTDFITATKYYSKSLDLNTNSKILNSRGLCFYYLKKYDLAYKDFDNSIALDTNFAEAYNNRGSSRYNNQNIALANKEDLEFAYTDFTKAIQLEPKMSLAYRNRGVINMFLNKQKEAEQDLQKAIILKPNDAIALMQYARFLSKQNDCINAIEYLNKSLTYNNYLPETYIERIVCFIKINNLENAKKDCAQVAQISNENQGKAAYYLAKIAAIENQKDNSIKQLKIAQKEHFFKKDKSFILELINDTAFEKYKTDKKFQQIIHKIKYK